MHVSAYEISDVLVSYIALVDDTPVSDEDTSLFDDDDDDDKALFDLLLLVACSIDSIGWQLLSHDSHRLIGLLDTSLNQDDDEQSELLSDWLSDWLDVDGVVMLE